MAEHHGAKHDLFGQLLGLRFDHHHRIGSAGFNDEIKTALDHFVDLRIEHIFVVDEADASRADRAHERGARDGQRGGGRNHRKNVRIVFRDHAPAW